MKRARVLSTLLALLWVVSCSDDAGKGTREALPDLVVCVAGELTLPDGRCQPAGLPPDMPCPPGERALAGGSCQAAGVTAEACASGKFVPDGRGGCDAILPEATCPPGLMAVPGETACREVSPCGAGTWGNIQVEANTQYVDQGYPGSDSDGSQEKPWKTVQAGVRAAADGAIVAVAEGRYAEEVRVVRKPVRLWGRCPARTVVAGLSRQSGAIVIADAGAFGSEVRGLAITGPGYGVWVRGARRVALQELWVHDAGVVGVVATEGANVTLRGALVEENHAVGVAVLGSEATVKATVVRATEPDSAGEFGYGIDVGANQATGEGGTLWLTASLIEENHSVGVFVEGSKATVEATVVRATQRDREGRWGHGIDVQPNPATGEGGKLWLTASLVEENHEVGVFVEGSEATVEATVVRATQPGGAGLGGRGIDIERSPATGEGGKLWLNASLVEENHDAGVFVEGSEATVEATVVRATQPDDAGQSGSGLFVHRSPETGEGGKLWLTASLVEENHDVGVFVAGSEATVEATVVRATQPNGAGQSGRGINVQAGSHAGEGGKLWLTASLVEENHEIGVAVEDSEATVEATVVRATQPNGAGEFGRGIEVARRPETGEGGKLWLTAALVEENHEIGVFVEGSEARVEATVVRATQPDRAGKLGRGIEVERSLEADAAGKLWLTASLVEENHQVGVLVSGSEVTVETTVVRTTKRSPADTDYGDGILVIDERGESHVTIAATASTDNARAGVFYLGSKGELSAVRSSGNRFGLVLEDGISGARPTLEEGNLFEGNIEQDRILGGDLAVPVGMTPLP